MLSAALALALVAADPQDESHPSPLEILRTFREEFVHIRPGQGSFPVRFSMGRNAEEPTERPLHQTHIEREFYMARHEVPQNLWQLVMHSNPSRWKGPRNAVESVSFHDGVEFCRRVTQSLREVDLITGTQVVRLPSETEWEYCARAGSSTLYCFGDDPDELGDYAWFNGNAKGHDPPVGAKKPNAWGLYDMHGYVWEWCADPWHDTHAGSPADGSVWSKRGDPKRRTLRGGSWKDPADRVLSTTRRAAYMTTRDDALGLRCVLAELEAADSTAALDDK